MKLEYVSDPTLLTRIKRSFAHVKRLKEGEEFATKLFVFERVDCSKIEVDPVRVRLWNFCLNVTVVLTGEKFVTTQRMSFRESHWTLYRVKGAKR